MADANLLIVQAATLTALILKQLLEGIKNFL
jgi:hypothetical protein